MSLCQQLRKELSFDVLYMAGMSTCQQLWKELSLDVLYTDVNAPGVVESDVTIIFIIVFFLEFWA